MLYPLWNMSVTMKKDIPLLERRQVLLVKMMAVGGKNYLLPTVRIA